MSAQGKQEAILGGSWPGWQAGLMGIGKKTAGSIVFGRRTRAQYLLFLENNGQAAADDLVCRRKSHTKLLNSIVNPECWLARSYSASKYATNEVALLWGAWCLAVVGRSFLSMMYKQRQTPDLLSVRCGSVRCDAMRSVQEMPS